MKERTANITGYKVIVRELADCIEVYWGNLPVSKFPKPQFNYKEIVRMFIA